MASVSEHYEGHLAPIYLWMAGGHDAAFEAGTEELRTLGLPAVGDAVVYDLGAGFGMHAIPLARAGARVTAVDSSAILLAALDDLRGELPIRTINGDLLDFRRHMAQEPSAILCMGDTITHLQRLEDVARLVEDAAAVLPPGGALIVSFRDYSSALVAEQRFIPVKSDENRILVCFLEFEGTAVAVHDILHERTQLGWTTKVSAYRKLRLPPDDLVGLLCSNGFRVRREVGMRGMVRLVAHAVDGRDESRQRRDGAREEAGASIAKATARE